jgi:integrase
MTTEDFRWRDLHDDVKEAFLFRQLVNYRTLKFARPLSTRMVQNIVHRWGDYSGAGKVSPHDLRRTAITWPLDLGSATGRSR